MCELTQCGADITKPTMCRENAVGAWVLVPVDDVHAAVLHVWLNAASAA